MRDPKVICLQWLTKITRHRRERACFILLCALPPTAPVADKAMSQTFQDEKEKA